MAKSEKHDTLPAPDASGKTLLIVRAPYYKSIADNLLDGARNAIEASGAKHELIDVPGALEIAPAIAMASRTEKYDGFVALGCVIRGETSHYETVCEESARGITLLGLSGVCIGNGILTVENRKQADVRADPSDQNKGAGAAEAALHLMAFRETLEPKRRIGFGFAPESEQFIMAEKS